MKRHPKVTQTCKFCEKEFKIHFCTVQKGLGSFCSVKCSNTYKNKHILPLLNNKKITVKCKLCHIEFKGIPSELKRGHQKFCSKKCSLEYKKKTCNIECVCKHCGQKFKVKKSSKNRPNNKKSSGKYCSKNCQDQSRKNRTTHQCIKCGQCFQVKASSQNKNFFCSRHCYIHYGGRTWIEKVMAESLQKINFNYEEQKYIKGTKYHTYVDFFIKPNICLYVDGDYWHSLPENKQRDVRNNRWLKKEGFVVIRISETQIKKGEMEYLSLLPLNASTFF